MTMTVLGVWASGLPRLLCALTGILVGYGISALFGLFPADFAAKLADSPIFAVPDPRFLSFGFEPSLMVPLRSPVWLRLAGCWCADDLSADERCGLAPSRHEEH